MQFTVIPKKNYVHHTEQVSIYMCVVGNVVGVGARAISNEEPPAFNSSQIDWIKCQINKQT